ncbi:hypothetical protein [Polyangium sp. 6x1]|uniref:DUF6968 family protein n=1 Tax=Polyangium sp. 6x1 TaxID=3042689 RepID=UPI0024828D9D|nr:hypothetical protein [Polyangium sp. 6x1]MDI1446273.1 hypothetical protein [Polyangium sp. 6x1]
MIGHGPKKTASVIKSRSGKDNGESVAGEERTKTSPNVIGDAVIYMSDTSVFAERSLRFTPHGKRGGRRVLVRIHAPVVGNNQNWSVLVEILGPGKRVASRTIWGYDAVQALLYALALVPLDLGTLAHELGGKVTFLGSDDLGFSAAISTR